MNILKENYRAKKTPESKGEKKKQKRSRNVAAASVAAGLVDVDN